MKTKYIKEKIDGSFVYPSCPDQIKSKEDLKKWFDHTSQLEEDIDDKEHLLARLPAKFIKNQTSTEIIIMFQRCKHSASAMFSGKECYRISL